MATPIRTCVGCGRSRSIATLVRVAVVPGEGLRIGGGLPGRGAWLCSDRAADCARVAQRRKRWSVALKAPVDRAAGERLVAELLAEEKAGSR